MNPRMLLDGSVRSRRQVTGKAASYRYFIRETLPVSYHRYSLSYQLVTVTFFDSYCIIIFMTVLPVLVSSRMMNILVKETKSVSNPV